LGALVNSSDRGVRWRAFDRASAVNDWQQVGSA
jgi:hypothetical protein